MIATSQSMVSVVSPDFLVLTSHNTVSPSMVTPLTQKFTEQMVLLKSIVKICRTFHFLARRTSHIS